MDFDEEDNDIILMLLEASGITNQAFYQNQDGSQYGLAFGYNVDQKSVYHNIKSELKLQDGYDYQTKIFSYKY